RRMSPLTDAPNRASTSLAEVRMSRPDSGIDLSSLLDDTTHTAPGTHQNYSHRERWDFPSPRSGCLGLTHGLPLLPPRPPRGPRRWPLAGLEGRRRLPRP